MAHERYDLTDFDWKTIKPLLQNKPRGVPKVVAEVLRIYSSASSPAAGLKGCSPCGSLCRAISG